MIKFCGLSRESQIKRPTTFCDEQVLLMPAKVFSPQWAPKEMLTPIRPGFLLDFFAALRFLIEAGP